MDRYKADMDQQFDNEQALVLAYMNRAVADAKDVIDVFNAMNLNWLQDVTMTNDNTAPTYTAATTNFDEYIDAFDHFQYDVGHLEEYAPDWQSSTYGYAEAPTQS